MSIRLDKYLADSGFGTRSDVAQLVKSGSVLVNGNIEKDRGRKILPDSDVVSVGGKDVGYTVFEYYMLNKPAGVITASKDKKEKTVVDLIKNKKHRNITPVGRLDRDTEGLLLITDDGQLAHELLAPGKHVDKIYLALVSGNIPENAAALFKEGIDIGDEKPAKEAELIVYNTLEEAEDTDIMIRAEEILNDSADIFEDGSVKYLTAVRITLREGRYHEIKRMFQSLGCRVEYLKRVSMGPLVLDPELEKGEYRELYAEEIEALKKRS